MGSCLLNEISGNLVGHRRKSAKTKRPLIKHVRKARPAGRQAAKRLTSATARIAARSGRLPAPRFGSFRGWSDLPLGDGKAGPLSLAG
jgi:hypothetical protein